MQKKTKQMEINSLENKKVKNLLKLKKSSERRKQGIFLVEGEREIKIAQKSGLKIHSIYISKDYDKKKENLKFEKPIYVSREIFDKITYRENPDGYIALFFSRKYNLEECKPKKTPLFLILESIEKPGNIGAVLRTADATNIDGVIINNPVSDIYSPNAIRSSQGTVFSVPVYFASIKETNDFCKENNINIYATTPRAEKEYIDFEYIGGTAILMGAESTGLSPEWLELAKNKVKIKMEGEIDSLNISVSASIVLYEAKRQRNIHN